MARAAGYRVIAGVDEAGCGPWAGPVVAAAVILRRARLSVRIDDSKRLTSAQRAVAFDAIHAHADIGVGIVAAPEIDAQNIRRAALRAMEAALLDLPCSPDLAIADGNQAPSLGLPCWTIIDGDRLSYVVSCASIVAKVTRDGLMRFYHRLFPDYAFEQHKGYGTRLHLERLQTHGPSALHRFSFEPVARVARRLAAVAPPTCSDVDPNDQAHEPIEALAGTLSPPAAALLTG